MKEGKGGGAHTSDNRCGFVGFWCSERLETPPQRAARGTRRKTCLDTRPTHCTHIHAHLLTDIPSNFSRPDVSVLVLPWSCLRSNSLVCLIIAGGLDAPCLLITVFVIFTITFAIAVIKAKAVEEVVHATHFLLLVSVLPVALRLLALDLRTATRA